MSKATPALLKMALLLCAIAMLASGGLPAFGQAGVKPAPSSTPTRADIHGGTHTFMKEPVVAKQPKGGSTIIFQVGKSGILVGRVDLKLRDGRVIAAAGCLLDLRDEALA